MFTRVFTNTRKPNHQQMQRLLNTSFVCHKKDSVNTAKGRKVGSTKWLNRQLNDPYVKRAREENYRCRSAFKLIEMDDKYGILQPGHTVIDCGAAPGSWTEVAVQRTRALGDENKVIAIDLQHISHIKGASILQYSDFTNTETQQKILQLLSNQRVDTVLSDMAPSACGIKSLDHDNVIHLVLSALKFSFVVLKDGGTFLCKIFHGDKEDNLRQMLKSCFKEVTFVKPGASRDDSSEVFLLARDFKKPKSL